MKTKIIIATILLSQFLILSCKDHVRIILDKNKILPGETVTARLYVNNIDAVLPAFSVVWEQDTVRLPIDTNDRDCGVYKGTYRSQGEKVIKGYVDFIDKNNKRQIFNYRFKFTVLPIPEIPKQNK